MQLNLSPNVSTASDKKRVAIKLVNDLAMILKSNDETEHEHEVGRILIAFRFRD